MNNKLWIAHITTYSGDHYFLGYTSEPTFENVLTDFVSEEGSGEYAGWDDWDSFSDNTSVSIEPLEVVR